MKTPTLVILPAGTEPSKIKWTVREYVGATVYRVVDGQVSEEPATGPLLAGDGVSFYGMTGTVKQGEDGKLYAENSNAVSPLDFGEDERKCWVSGGIISRKAIEMISKLELSR